MNIIPYIRSLHIMYCFANVRKNRFFLSEDASLYISSLLLAFNSNCPIYDILKERSVH